MYTSNIECDLPIIVTVVNHRLIVDNGDRRILKHTGIYQIICKINKFQYIGSTCCGFRKRLRNHIVELENGVHDNWILQRDWKRYGKDAFFFRIIEICEPAICLEREQYYLDLYGVGERNFSYNILSCARNCAGRPVSEETRKKISTALKGRKLSLETCLRMSELLKGRIFSAEHRARLSAANKGRKLSPEHKKKLSDVGKNRERRPCSQETRRKLSIAHRGKSISAETRAQISESLKGKTYPHMLERKYIVVSPSGEIWRTDNLRAFCKTKGLSRRALAAVVCGLRSHHKGWTCYYDDLDVEPQIEVKQPPKQKRYKVTTPLGEEFIVDNLRQFCLKQGLLPNAMHNVISGLATHHQGWKAERIE